jgi:hypothetical protein
MIKAHEFNSRWWGEPVGLVTDPAFFKLENDDQQEQLEAYDWVEFRMSLESSEAELIEIHEAGFFQVDTQINYRLGFRNLPAYSSLDKLEVEFADEKSFSLDSCDVMPFDHERFVRLPGISAEKTNERYALWSNEHLSAHPHESLRILHEGDVQGWYFADSSAGKGLNLTLGMLSRNATVSGLLVFLKSYRAFATRGHRMGWASFSVNNTPVHNIYASVGAHFIRPVGHWLWMRDG